MTKEEKCDICERVFNTKISLKNHYNHQHNHSGKMYHCNICMKSVQSQSAVTAHIKEVHGVKNYSCTSCGKSFSRKERLKIHVH